MRRQIAAARRGLSWLWSVREFAGKERSSRLPDPGPIGGRADLWSRGFLAESRVLYNLGAHPAGDYLSDFARLQCKRINGSYSILLNDKLLFERVFGPRLGVPENLALARGGSLRSISPSLGLNRPVGLGELLSRSPDGFVCKPVSGGGGEGIVVVRRGDGGSLRRNGQEIEAARFEEDLGRLDRYVLVAFVRQSAWSSRLNPSTTNTVRVLTMLDPDTEEPFIARCVQRIGVRRSAPVDNWSQGGLSARVDPDTGRLGPGATYPIDGVVRWHDTHPETGAAIAGETIPHWASIRAALLDAVRLFPMLRYVGWDVIPTDEGFSVIEGNFRSDVNLLQIHGGLLADPRVRRFYEAHGIVRPRARGEPVAGASAASR